MRQVDLKDKYIFEIGAGDIRHSKYWLERPAKYILADVHLDMMQKAQTRLKEKGISFSSMLLEREQTLPLEDNSVDVIVSFIRWNTSILCRLIWKKCTEY